MNNLINFFFNYADLLIKLTRKKKLIILIITDILFSISSLIITYVGFNYLNINLNNFNYYIFFIILIFSFLPLAFYYDIYKILNRESLLYVLYKIYLIFFTAILFIFIFDLFINIIFFKIFSLTFFTLFILEISFFRILISKIDKNRFRDIKSQNNFTFIYGVGSGGKFLLDELCKKINRNNIIFIDDDLSKQNMIFEGHSVISLNSLDYYLKKKLVKEIILAMPSIDKSRRIQIIDSLQKKKCQNKVCSIFY